MTKILPSIALALFALTLSLADLRAADEPDQALTGPPIVLTIDELHPTQFAVGGIEVKKHAKKLDETIKDKKAPFVPEGKNEMEVVRAPDGAYYIVNGHHHLKALDEIGVKEAQVIMVADWSKREHPDNLKEDMAAFWKKMEAHNFVYLKDENGQDRTVEELPRHLKGMKDDPFRSIAWYVRRAGGFDKTEKPFAEFRWAEYFRERIKLKHPDDPEEFSKAVREALEEAGKKEAAGLPGYHLPKEDCGTMWARIAEHLPKK